MLLDLVYAEEDEWTEGNMKTSLRDCFCGVGFDLHKELIAYGGVTRTDERKNTGAMSMSCRRLTNKARVASESRKWLQHRRCRVLRLPILCNNGELSYELFVNTQTGTH